MCNPRTKSPTLAPHCVRCSAGERSGVGVRCKCRVYIPQVAETNTPGSMDAIGKCFLYYEIMDPRGHGYS